MCGGKDLVRQVLRAFGRPRCQDTAGIVEPDVTAARGREGDVRHADGLAVVWFDTDAEDGSPHNFRPDTDSAARAAYRAMARRSRFGG